MNTDTTLSATNELRVEWTAALLSRGVADIADVDHLL